MAPQTLIQSAGRPHPPQVRVAMRLFLWASVVFGMLGAPRQARCHPMLPASAAVIEVVEVGWFGGLFGILSYII